MAKHFKEMFPEKVEQNAVCAVSRLANTYTSFRAYIKNLVALGGKSAKGIWWAIPHNWPHLLKENLLTSPISLDDTPVLSTPSTCKFSKRPSEDTASCGNTASVQFSSVAQSCLTLCDPELQHTRPPCPSPAPGIHSDSHLSSQWCHPAISSSVVPFSSCPQSLPASESFPMS